MRYLDERCALGRWWLRNVLASRSRRGPTPHRALGQPLSPRLPRIRLTALSRRRSVLPHRSRSSFVRSTIFAPVLNNDWSPWQMPSLFGSRSKRQQLRERLRSASTTSRLASLRARLLDTELAAGIRAQRRETIGTNGRASPPLHGCVCRSRGSIVRAVLPALEALRVACSLGRMIDLLEWRSQTGKFELAPENDHEHYR